jgi:hypothetical protein
MGSRAAIRIATAESALRKMITSVQITVALLDGQKIRRHLRTPPQNALTPDGVESVLQQEAARVEQFFPGREFRLVPLRGGRDFNFVEVEKDQVKVSVP